jgi:hypothetical protein
LKAGEAWHRLQWVLGLKRLGLRVFFVEQIGAGNCQDAAGRAAGFEESVNLAYLQQISCQFGWADSAVLVCEEGRQTFGLGYRELLDLAEGADLLVNISGHLTLPEVVRRFRRKVYIDEDPGFTQFWQASGNLGDRLEGYDFFFTVGENVGTAACPIPTGGIRWRPTRPFAVLHEWPVCAAGEAGRFTTIGSWRGPYGPVEFGGKVFGLKVHEFRKFLELPRRSPYTFELALDIHPADGKDLEALRGNGWKIVDPKQAVPDPAAFRKYLQTSSAEFSTAKGVYVETNSGWFSDRTVRYLASGKPALVQDTGFGRNYPAGEGLLAFRTLEETVAGAEAIVRDYEKHSRAARKLAETFFDSDKVLTQFLEEVGI